ncbi:hypothetical protein RD792_004347 [Penstemon davidsonii]|uniref:DNA replication ATP-dependent helicase/nuclease n=1 Tax=Penstemon davidsonii TaxID=160366 RepID=A0ABR0DH62_9LAMI|nr:hypothetical protein RD792_004347 [Penstemon davidsonii]
MAPRKRMSSGGKKSSNQSREQPPSQPSKFGIQHFFDRHTQSQKALSQRQNGVSENAVSENHKNNAVNSIKSDENNGTSEYAENGKGGELREKDTPTDKLLPVVIDDEKNQVEVSPEPSKSVSIKRAKFSPGMLIKQSQDDVVNEVTWRISPVNEKLHAMSKHLPGTIRVLADSSRFNSLNFQQCSQKKVCVQTSPDKSGKLEKWLSSPPLKASEKSVICSDRVSSRNVNSDHSVKCHGNNSSLNRNITLNTRSPFSTPPSLSCSHDKVIMILNALDNVYSHGVLDQLGPRQHKKALIELLDQVEDVISVEHCKDDKTFADADTSLKPDLAAESSTRNSEENNCSKISNSNFLVLEVSSDSSGSQSPAKVLRLLNEKSGEERALHLWDEWYYSVVAPGDTVHVIGEFDPQGKCDVNRDKNFVTVHPDILVSGTRVSSSFSCPRRTVLDERLKHNEHSAPALIGTLLHQIFQAGLISEFPTKKFLEEYARTVLQKSLESLYACGVLENDILKTLIEAIPKLLNWISCFRDSQGPRSSSIDFKCEEGLKNIKISEVIDIEEMAWAPKYGLKGMIDASVRIRINTNSTEASEMIMPLEFKTGKGTNGQESDLSSSYGTQCSSDVIYSTNVREGISVKRSDLIGLIMRRNELANDLFKASTTQQLPPMLQLLYIMCYSHVPIMRNFLFLCPENLILLTVKAYGGTAEGSGLGDMYDSLVSHLTPIHTTFLRNWERLVDLEAKHMEVAKKESWCSENLRKDHHNSLSSLVLDASDKSSQKRFCRGDRFVYRFVLRELSSVDTEQLHGDSSSSTSSLDHIFKSGDYVILSTEPGHLRIANGIIVDIGNSHVSVSFAKRLRLPGHGHVSMGDDLHQQSWRLDKDEAMASFAIMRYNLIQLFLQSEISSRLRKMIVDLEMPRYDSGCVFSQDPAISYVWSQKSLNDDQRRAIIKILTAKDYALILGMPGTGKTSTMVHAVKALLMRGASILLTSYTNSAVDNLLIKLKDQGIDFIRIGRYEAVHEQIQENCLSVMDMGSTQEIKQKMDKINVVAVTCLGISSPLLTNKRFDVCIMDEAGQITLPVSLGPLMFASKFVLVGDHYQLPPLVQSPEAKEKGMSVSLFCRLSEAHPQAIAALHCQYRMCADIMALSNALIYGNRLLCGSSEIENAKVKYRCSASAPTWLMEVLNPKQPVIFINTDLVPAYETNDHKAVNNPTEAFIIAEVNLPYFILLTAKVTKALLLRGIEGQDIGIITPYNSQANLIRGAVSEPVEIHTIDKYQGRDKDCILVSFVRSCENPRNNTASLLGDWHRINVALTRAKKKLIMVGSCTTLSRVPLLKLLIEKVEELSSMLVVSKKDINQKPELKRCSKFR